MKIYNRLLKKVRDEPNIYKKLGYIQDLVDYAPDDETAMRHIEEAQVVRHQIGLMQTAIKQMIIKGEKPWSHNQPMKPQNF